MLMRFDPFRDMDRLMELQGRGFPRSILAMDAFRRDQEFVVQFDLPGADPRSIDLSVEKNVLTVKAERPATRREGDEVIVTERRHGSFTRQLFLGDAVDTDHIKASYDNGVLTIAIPVAEKAKHRQIHVDLSVEGQPNEAREEVAAAA